MDRAPPRVSRRGDIVALGTLITRAALDSVLARETNCGELVQLCQQGEAKSHQDCVDPVGTLSMVRSRRLKQPLSVTSDLSGRRKRHCPVLPFPLSVECHRLAASA